MEALRRREPRNGPAMGVRGRGIEDTELNRVDLRNAFWRGTRGFQLRDWDLDINSSNLVRTCERWKCWYRVQAREN